MDFENTSLWSYGMNQPLEDAYQRQRDRIRSTYSTVWKHGSELASQISKDLPQLTLHDERHFNALWRRADQIIGDSEPLNPAELFVFGCAIVLHDAANSISAYEGGIKEIEESAEWRDELVERLRSAKGAPVDDKEIAGASEEIKKTVLLYTLRRIHAKRAEDLADISFRNEAGAVGRVINDDGLRNHLGRLIGLIAASHHWNIQDLPKKLPKIVGALAEFPATWTIRPIRITCLLRCADAIQVDQSRAPDFLYAMLDLRGISESHWRAQNRLLAPVNDPDDESALIFSSSRDFKSEDVEAWWIAYDAIRTANRELQDSFTLLKDIKQSPFQVNRIRDADSPDRLSRHVKVNGWRPVTAEVKVSNVGNVVKLFGGDQLYGADLMVPLRELIQNAADAVRRRREMPLERNYQGEITVRVRHIDDSVLIDVEDDGIGMSEATLTGPLIEFGSSYFGSSLAKDERPGMTARSGHRLGKYGVGFFSAFMIAKAVAVTSRPFDASVSDARTLRFANGFSLRPVLLEADAGIASSLTSTTVTMILRQDTYKKVLNLRVEYGDSGWVQVQLKEFFKVIACMVDVDIYVQEEAGERELVHSRRWFDGDWAEWASDVALRQYRSPEVQSKIDLLLPLLEMVDSGDPSLGIAALNPFFNRLGLATVAGLIGGAHTNSPIYDDFLIGCVDHLPGGPRRHSGVVRSRVSTAQWATRQASKFEGMKLSAREIGNIAQQVSEYGGNPWEIAQLTLNRVDVKMDRILDKLRKGDRVFLVTENERYRPNEEDRDLGRLVIERSDKIYPFSDDELCINKDIIESPVDLYGGFGSLYSIINQSKAHKSLLDLIDEKLLEFGMQVEIDSERSEVVATYIGTASERDGLVPGMEIICNVIPVKAKKVVVSLA